MRRTLACAAAVLVTACGHSDSISPTPSPTPTPEVTMSVNGWVFDSVDRAVPGARIEVVTGRLAGTSVTTDDAGQYAFAVPLPLFSEIKASKAGHLDSAERLTPATRIPLVFWLGSATPPILLSGQFDITFEADATCAALPDIARKRTYQANSMRPMTELSGALFAGGDPSWNVIVLQQFQDFARFSMSDPPIWEVIPDAGYVLISGEALGVVDPDSSELLMDGEFRYCSDYSPSMACSVEPISCRSARHLLTLKRR